LIPSELGGGIVIRPTYISMTNQLGVLPPGDAKLFVILSALRYSEINPIKIICNESVSKKNAKAFGHLNLGSNIGPILQYYKEVSAKGYNDILWLLDENVTELNEMNFFVYWVNEENEKELMTCPLDGTVLPGVIRDCVLELCRDWGVKVTERHFSIHELIKSIKENRVIEAFGAGTANNIIPVSEICYKSLSYKISENNKDAVGKRLADTLMKIQTGTGIINHKWVEL
jgi:branched-chain amino acid aminotransferase